MQMQKQWLSNDSTDSTKLLFLNNTSFRARNSGDSADIELFKLDGSDRLHILRDMYMENLDRISNPSSGTLAMNANIAAFGTYSSEEFKFNVNGSIAELGGVPGFFYNKVDSYYYFRSKEATGTENGAGYYLKSGEVAVGGSGASGNLVFKSGANNGSGNSGLVLHTSGNVDSGDSGIAFYGTGNSKTGNVGAVYIQGGESGEGSGGAGVAGAGSGEAIINSGMCVNCNSGQALFYSGCTWDITQAIDYANPLTANGSGNTGQIKIYSGSTGTGSSGALSLHTGYVNTLGNSGNLNINTGNAASGNSGNITIQTGTGTIRGDIIIDALNVQLKGIVSIDTDMDANSKKITNLADPTLAQDAVTLSYVTDLVKGYRVLGNVSLASVASDLSGASVSAPSGSVAGEEITVSSLPIVSTKSQLDGNDLTIGMRVLLKDFLTTDRIYNGVYDVTDVTNEATGSIGFTRVEELDNSPQGEIFNGRIVPRVINGDNNQNDAFVISSVGTGTDNVHIIDTDNILWASFPPTAISVSKKEVLTFATGTANYDLSLVAETDSIQLQVDGGTVQLEGAGLDYTVSYTGGAGGVTQITILTRLINALSNGDKLYVQYQK